jgi:hypothetical protein
MGHHILTAKELGEREGKLLKLADVPAYILKISGVLVKVRVIYDWIHKGKKRYTGHKLKLRATQRCGIWFTTEGWVQKFLRELNE